MECRVDSFKVIVIVSMLLCLASLTFIAYVAIDSIQGAKIPNQEYAMVISKSPVNDNPIANYTVVLSSGKTLYIPNNTTLFDSIQVNQSYRCGEWTSIANIFRRIDQILNKPNLQHVHSEVTEQNATLH